MPIKKTLTGYCLSYTCPNCQDQLRSPPGMEGEPMTTQKTTNWPVNTIAVCTVMLTAALVIWPIAKSAIIAARQQAAHAEFIRTAPVYEVVWYPQQSQKPAGDLGLGNYNTACDYHDIVNASYSYDTEQEGFVIWSRTEGRIRYKNVRGAPLGATAWKAKLGYAKCAIEEPRRLVVKTILLPGMFGTPECGGALEDGWSPAAVYNRMAQMADTAEWGPADYQMLRYFERLGFPQLRQVKAIRRGCYCF